MSERILDLRPKDLISIEAKALLQSIRAAEGRTILCEVVCPVMPLLYDITNAELTAAFGADIVLLNLYDAKKPFVFGAEPKEGETVIQTVKRISGRAIGVNLEPVDYNTELLGSRDMLPEGRIATAENARLCYEQGASLIVLTGNPKTGVSNEKIIEAIVDIRKELEDRVIIAAGKMHGAGTVGEMGEKIIKKAVINEFIKAGADIILLPAPGTVPGITVEFIKSMIDFIHEEGAIAMTAIGTSQEGADEGTIRSIALNCKTAGADIHHIGDAGYVGVAVPENIMAYSIAIRGRRHTYRRMSMRE